MLGSGAAGAGDGAVGVRRSADIVDAQTVAIVAFIAAGLDLVGFPRSEVPAAGEGIGLIAVEAVVIRAWKGIPPGDLVEIG